MRRKTIIPACVIILFVLSTPAGSTIRINGNQLLEGAGVYNRTEALKPAASVNRGSASVPARLVFSLGQGLMARGRLPDSMSSGGGAVAFRIGIGLGYDIANVAFDVYGPQMQICPITLDGDVNDNGSVTSADVIALVNYVFKGGDEPLPCVANGDVNCNGSVTSADIIYEVNYVFKGGDPPCDICNLSSMECIPNP